MFDDFKAIYRNDPAIRNIEFMERNDFFVYSYALDELPSHYFYNLLNANTCEL